MHKKEIFFALLIALVLAVVLSPFASSRPDGLERVAEDKGFIHRGEGAPLIPSPIPDYAVPGIANERIATSLAGLLGTLIVFGLTCGVAAVIRKGSHS
jgi:cobalt/nickel transport protein